MWFVDLALDQMADILRTLGDRDANRRPDLAGANSPFAIATHCAGVMEFWGGTMVAERPVVRDREAEFRASGSTDALIAQLGAARQQLAHDLSVADMSSPPPDILGPEDAGVPYARSKGAVLLHILEELLQHVGQMELTRDLLRG